MVFSRDAHRHCNYAGGKRQTRSFHIARLLVALRSARVMVEEMRPYRPGVYEVSPERVLEVRTDLDKADRSAADLRREEP